MLNKTLWRGAGIVAAGVAIALAACSDDPTTPADPVETAFLDIVPPGGATDVDPNEPIVVQFDHPMGYAVPEYAEVREGGVDGDLVPGAWVLSDDRTTLTFTPDQPLQPFTTYVIHLGGGMMDAEGHPLNFEQHGFAYGGEWCTAEQNQMGPMGQQHRHGAEWMHPNGTYGMFFEFTTGA